MRKSSASRQGGALHIDKGAGFRTLRGIRELPAFSSNCKGPDGVLGKIVGNIHLAVVQEHGQVKFLILSIGHRLRQLAAWNRVQGFQPQPISLKEGFSLHLTHCFSRRITHFGEFLLQSEQLVIAAIV